MAFLRSKSIPDHGCHDGRRYLAAVFRTCARYIHCRILHRTWLRAGIGGGYCLDSNLWEREYDRMDNDPLKKRQKQPLNRREIRAPVNGNLPLATPTFRRSCSFVPFLPSVLPGDLHPLRDLACLSIIIHRAFQDISPLSF